MPPSSLAPKPMGRRGAAFCSLPRFLCLAVTWLGQKGLPRCEHGLAQPHTCPRPLFPKCHLVRVRRWGWPCCNPLAAAGCPTAGLSSAPGPLCPAPPGAGGHRGTEVAICRFCCTGTARAWLSPLGSGPSGECPDLARVTGHCPPATQPLAFGSMSPWAGVPGDRAGSPFPI